MSLQFQGKYIITGKILCETGLHIGGTQEGVEIGGIDNIVIRDSLTNHPYIPGSSLKGKLRHLLEWQRDLVFHGKNDKNKFPAHSCENSQKIVELENKLKGNEKREEEVKKKIKELISRCPICLIFGSSAGGEPTRLTVRDAFPEKSTIKEWDNWLGEGVYTELKTENTIDRITSEANPRTMERVPAGSEFALEMIFDIYRQEDRSLMKNLLTAMHLLENSALGGSGTRGHGQIMFEKMALEFRPVEYYQTGAKPQPDKDPIIAALQNKQTVIEMIKAFSAMESSSTPSHETSQQADAESDMTSQSS